MLETIYTDFTTNLLPKIQEGLTITKDYFIDLFGRYIKYLIVVDTIEMVIGAILLTVSLWFGLRKKTRDWVKEDMDDYAIASFFAIAGIVVGIIAGLIMLFNGGFHLVKDIYIPEIRVIEKIQAYRNQ